MILAKMKYILFALLVVLSSSCDDGPELNEENLQDYLELNNGLILDNVVACAGGSEDGLLGSPINPTDVFFYPVKGAFDFKYYQADEIADSVDFSKYFQLDLDTEALFNGYLRKFNHTSFQGERMGVVTFKTEDRLHVSSPIRLKTNTKPTEVNSNLVEYSENGLMPSFTWNDGLIDENNIYFHVISDEDNNLISGTYTIEKNFSFYDLSNVVFNITDTTSIPSLEANSDYKFTLMGVSEDNWINLFAEIEFSTN